MTSTYHRLLIRLLALLRPLTRRVLGGEIKPASLLTISGEAGTEDRYFALTDLNLEVTAAYFVLFVGGCILSLLAIPLPGNPSPWVLGLLALPTGALMAESGVRRSLTSRAAQKVGRTGVPSPRIPRMLIPSPADLLLPVVILVLVLASIP